MKMNRFWALLLVLTMLLGMIPAVSAAGDVTEVSTSADFVTAMANGGNIKLTAGFALSSPVEVPASVTVVLDLNGQTISSANGCANYIGNAGNLTIMDSSGEKNGCISVTSENAGAKETIKCVVNTGTLVINGGNFTAISDKGTANAVRSEAGSVTINAGTFYAKYNSVGGYNPYLIYVKATTLTINGGDFTAESISADSGSRVAVINSNDGSNQNITINGGNFTAWRNNTTGKVCLIRMGSNNVTINGGVFKLQGGNDQTFVDKKGTNITVVGGTYLKDNNAVCDMSGLITSDYTQVSDGTVAKKVGAYSELKDAVANGGSIAITAKITLEGVVEIGAGKTVVLDLNGQTIESSNGRSNYFYNKGSLTIKDSVGDGQITAVGKSSDSGESRTNCIANEGDLTITGGKIISNSESFMNYAIYSPAGNLTITGGIIEAKQNSGSNIVQALGLGGNGKVEISNATFTVTGASKVDGARAAIIYLIANAAPQITVHSGTFSAELHADSVVGGSFIREKGTNNSSASLTINGGTFNIAVGSRGIVDNLSGSVVITGGKFSGNVSDYLPTGYTQTASGVVVSNSQSEGTVVNTTIELQDAVDAGGTVIVGSTITLDELVTIPTGVTVVLDLNGKEIITKDGNTRYIVNNGNLTIKDSSTGKTGKITATSEETASGSNSIRCLYNYGTLVVDGGTFCATATNKYSAYGIYNYGDITVNNGAFHAEVVEKTGYAMCHAISLKEDAILTIYDGEFTAASSSTDAGSRVSPLSADTDSTAEIVIHDGDFTSSRTGGSIVKASIIRLGSRTKASVEIKGGTFTTISATAYINDDDNGGKNTLNISGGTFYCDGNVFEADPTSVTGGTFVKIDGSKNDISDKLAEGYIQAADGAVVAGATTGRLIAQLISYYTNYQDAAAADIYCVLAQLKQLDPAMGASWEKIMKFWSAANAEGFVNVGAVPQGLPNDNSLCIVILGYALNDDGTMKDELVGRLRTGLAIANAYPNAYVCVTGGGTAANNPNVTEAGLMAAWLQENGLAENRLIIEDKAGSTVANAKNTYDVLVSNYQSVDNIVMVTSDYHIVRGSLLYYTKFVLEAQATGGKQIGIIANCGFDTNKTYESVVSQAKSLCTLVGITYNDLPTVELTTQIKEVKSSADFCTAMNAGGYIKLTGSFTLEAKTTIPASVTVILDLNGKTITSNDGSANYIHNQGTLTITDSSSIAVGGITADQTSTSSKGEVYCVNNDGVLTVEKGNFTASSVGGTAYAIFSKGSSVTLNGGNFTASYNNKSGDYQAQTLAFGGTNATVTVGGDVKVTAESINEKTWSRCATVYTMSSSDNLQVTINGGTFTSTRTVGTNGASTLRDAGDKVKVTINGGTFRATNAGSDYMFNTMKGELNITGGTFIYDGQAFANKTANITGGIFLTTGNAVLDVSDYVASTHAQLDDGSVKAKETAADVTMIGATAYKSLWEALSKSNPGETIVLNANAKPMDAVEIPEGVTLDLNGNELDAAYVFGDAGQILDSTQTGLLKVAKNSVSFNNYNQQLPVWDEAAGGYRMAQVKIQVKTGTDKTTGAYCYYFRYDLTNADWEKLLPGSEVALQLRVEGYEDFFAADNEVLNQMYQDATGRGAIKVIFRNRDDLLNIRIGVVNRDVDIGKFSGAEPTPVMTLVGPTGTVDTLASDVRTYLANAADKYDKATEAELETMTTAKSSDTQSLYTSMQAVEFNWTLENAEVVGGSTKFYIQLSQDADFASFQSIRCTRFVAGKRAQSEPVWNLMTGTTYYWRVVTEMADGTQLSSDVQTFTTAAGPRQIHADGISNARDLGGWTRAYDIELSDGTVLKAGTTVAQGFTYRSAKLEYATDAGKNTLINELGINFEIDLRSGTSSTLNEKAMPVLENNFYRGDSAKQYAAYINEPTIAGLYLKNFTKAENYPIIFHCNGGADRTGSLAFILGALQGVSEADLIKDYEFTSKRLVNGYTDGTFRDFPALLKAFHALEGETPYEKARTFCLNAGLTDAEIDCIIQYMNGNLDYTP